MLRSGMDPSMPSRFPTGMFPTQKLEVVCANYQDLADLSTMAVSIVLILNRAKFLYPSQWPRNLFFQVLRL